MTDLNKATCFSAPRLVSITDLIQRLDDGAMIVTGNRRLSRMLHQEFGRTRVAAGHTVWPTPDILPWEGWLQSLWQNVSFSVQHETRQRMLLSSHQEHGVWRELMIGQADDLIFQRVDETVARMMEAWQTMQAWCLPHDVRLFDRNVDTRLFLQLADAFKKKCQQNNWFTVAELSAVLTEHIRVRNLPLPHTLILTGFDEWTPQQKLFLHALEQAGCELQWWQIARSAEQINKLACDDSHTEIQRVALWIKQCLQENPAARIALVVPELAMQRETVCRILDEVLIPEALQPGQHDRMRPYNLSLGRPLSRYPLVQLALDMLELAVSKTAIIELPLVSRILRSSFISGGDQERSARALLDAHLRESGEGRLTITRLQIAAVRSDQSYACPLLAQMLERWIQQTQEQFVAAYPSQWAQRFSLWLKTAGWPGERALSSEEYQLMQAWQNVLKAFSALDWVSGSIDFITAKQQLKRMVGETIFQPESAETPVQVLGLFETSGLTFDYLWISGLHDGVFPGSPRPNPFLPLQLQREADAPHSSAERELRVATRTLQRILQSATKIVISYPQRDGDEVLAPSPLIDAIPELDKAELSDVSPVYWQDLIFNHRQQIALLEDEVPVFTEAVIPGGSRMFKLQAACPFLAFAELRLGAKPLGCIQTGLSPQARGILLHRVMEMVWATLGSSTELVVMAPEALDALVAEKVSLAIQEIVPRYPYSFGSRLQALEHQRLHVLILAWLEMEKQRPDFQVLAREQKIELMINTLRVRLKIDRIDHLQDGDDTLLIDYKTGEAKAADWFGERLNEPQLPLYSVALAEKPSGIAFARIRAGDTSFEGVADEDLLLPGVESYKKLKHTREANSWQEIQADWQQTIEQLTQDFVAGKAEVDPKQYPQTCTYCALKSLCRIERQTGNES